ncbi:hypothetical protein F4779DRAFT_616903 [Xylariaceae sp. FL0662B]|nr:hypothetical protein F4779DRAFT_616903 [Xylariaceae sp. FL0662B]
MAQKRQTWIDRYEIQPTPSVGAENTAVKLAGQPSASSTQPRTASHFPTSAQIWDEAMGRAHDNASDHGGNGNYTHGDMSKTRHEVSSQAVQGISGGRGETLPKSGLMQSRWAPETRDRKTLGASVQPKDLKQSFNAEMIGRATGARPEANTTSVTTNIDILSNFSDAGAGSERTTQPNNQQRPRDSLEKHPAQVWAEQDLNAVRPSGKEPDGDGSYKSSLDSDQVAVASEYLVAYIKGWVQTTREVVADFLSKGINDHEDCDVNTDTGTLMSPIVYPPTKRSGNPLMSQLNDNSQLHIDRALTQVPAPPKPKKKARIVEPKKQPLPEREPHFVKIPSHLRPAVEDDVEQVMGIYNDEVLAGHTLVDMNPISLVKFRQLFLGTVREKLPFIVAVEGWHNPSDATKGRIIGFVVMDVLTRGIMGSYATYSNPAGKLTVVVHPDFRRNNLCRAMLDTIFACTSRDYKPKLGYQFIQPTPLDHRYIRPYYERPNVNARLWQTIDMEVIIQTDVSKEVVEGGEEFQWIRSFLSQKFGMRLVGHDVKFYKKDDKKHLLSSDGDSILNHNMTWYDRLTFRHYCEGYRLAREILG